MKQLLFLPALLFFTLAQAQKTKYSEAQKKAMRETVVEACRHAWNGYRQYAWGYDELQPLTRTGKNWYPVSMLMTPVDAFDTFVMLGMKEEAEQAKALIFQDLRFDVDNSVQVFEIVIRLLGGLESAYELDGDKRFLQLAEDLADRLMPAFNTPTGIPYRYIHLQTGALRDSLNNPAEIGTLMMEFGKLSQLTRNPKYYAAAKKAMMEVYRLRGKTGLVGMQIDAATGRWTNTEAAIGACIDSYYEYLYKCWKLFGDQDFRKAWEVHQKAIVSKLVVQTPNGAFLRHIDMNTGKELAPHYGALDAFYAGLCAYAGDLTTARKNQQANYYMWTRFGIEPEEFNYQTGEMRSAYYVLRPENLESCFYLYRFTRDDQYLRMGERMVNDILAHCRTESGFASLKDVRTKEKSNSMQSFFFAETLKYAWLLFAPDSALDLKKVVLNTEAHPMRIRK